MQYADGTDFPGVSGEGGSEGENRRAEKQAPVYDFVSEDGIGHRVWVIDNDSDVAMIEEAFGKIPAIYIADGHHRCASAVKVGLKRREQYPDYTGEEEFNYFLSVISRMKSYGSWIIIVQ